MPPGGRGMGGPMGGQFLTEEEKKNQPKVTHELLKRVFSYLKPYTKQLILVLLCIIVSSFFSLLPSPDRCRRDIHQHMDRAAHYF